MLDVAVIGAGHNGLVAAAYLARAGLSVTCFERRDIAGGACVTEELWPGVGATSGGRAWTTAAAPSPCPSCTAWPSITVLAS